MPVLVGRARESAALRGLLGRAAAGQGGLALVSGEPGIGKRSLLADLTAYARTERALVLTGRATPGSGPYRAISDALSIDERLVSTLDLVGDRLTVLTGTAGASAPALPHTSLA